MRGGSAKKGYVCQASGIEKGIGISRSEVYETIGKSIMIEVF